MEPLLEQIRLLLGDTLFTIIINPHTERPYIFSSFKKRHVYNNLSGGERALVHLAYDLYNGSGKSNLNELNCLDHNNRIRALNAIQNFLQVPRL